MDFFPADFVKNDPNDFKSTSGSHTCDNTAGAVDVCSLNLTGGTWLLIGFSDMNVSLPNDAMSMAIIPIGKSARTSCLGGGGLLNGGIVKYTSDFTAKVSVYAASTWGSSVVLRGTLWAYKLSD